MIEKERPPEAATPDGPDNNTPKSQSTNNSRQSQSGDLEKQVQRRIEAERTEFCPEPESERVDFRFVKAANIETTIPEWLIKCIVEANTLIEIFGDPESLKTFILIAMSCCIATGTPFYGYEIKKSGPVLLIIGEGFAGIKRRILAWCNHFGVKIEDLPVFISTRKAALCDPDSATEVVRAVETFAVEHGQPPVLVGIDTVARNFGPGDENRTEDMTRFVDACDAIRQKYQSTVALVHHTGHSEKHRPRGAIALRAALDAEYRVDRDAENVIRFEATKMKDAERPEPMAFRINIVDLGMVDEDGEPVTSVVLDQTSYAPPPIKGKRGRGAKQTVAMEILRNLFTERRQKLADTDHDPDTARVSVDEWKHACLDAGMARSTYNSVKKSLLEQGKIFISKGFVEL